MTEHSIDAVVTDCPKDLFIDGKWQGSKDGRRFQVLDPATNQSLCDVADASEDDARKAMDAAARNFAEWSSTSPRFRSDILMRAFHRVHERADYLARLVTLEMGKPVDQSHAEVVYGAEFLRWYAEEAVRIAGRYGPNPAGTGRAFITKHPIGPVYLVTPWNFPLAMATRKISPALAAGCTVVMKPAEASPLTTLAFADILIEAGLPPGVINVLPTTRPAEVTDAIMSDLRLRKISFTGSTAVGKQLMKQAADRVLAMSMELGGNAPFIVFEDADLDLAVTGAVQAKFRNIGQACTAANRFLVQRSVAEQFAQALAGRVGQMKTGPGLEADVDIGPLISGAAVVKATRLVNDAVNEGAKVLNGQIVLADSGRTEMPSAPVPDRESWSAGNYFATVVLTDVPPQSEILRQEIFGPVAPIVTFDSEDEAVLLANNTEFGLASYVFTKDLARAQRMIEALHTGIMGINTGLVSDAFAPFGGWAQSGLGREGGSEGIEDFLEVKYSLTPDPFGAEK